MWPKVPMALVAPDSIKMLPAPVLGKVLVAAAGWVTAVVAALTVGVVTFTVAVALAVAVGPVDVEVEVFVAGVEQPVKLLELYGLELPELKRPFRSWPVWMLQISDVFTQPSR
jgi:hypothetical protein